MDIQESKKLVAEGYRLFQNGDIRNLLELYHDDAEWIGPESEFLPFSGSFHGKQGITQFFTKLDAAAQAVRFEIKQIIAEGDTVVVRGESTWLARATGRSYDNPWVHVLTLRDGKVAQLQSYYDTAPGERAFRPEQPGQASAAAPLHH